MNKVWWERREGVRWRSLQKKVKRAPTGTPVSARMKDYRITVTINPIDEDEP